MALSLTLCILILILLIGSAWLLAQSAAKRFQDAPDRDPYLDRLWGEIEDAARKDIGGGMAASSSALGINDIAHRGSGV